MSVPTMAGANGTWLPGGVDPGSDLRLFCLPHAGGGASLFDGWAAALPRCVAVCPIELPGRGARRSDTPIDRLDPLVAVLVPALEPHLDRPFALFGHSMGALAAFELARALRRRGRAPLHLFAAGFRAPQDREEGTPTYLLPDAEFRATVGRLGSPDWAAREPEQAALFDLAEPLLRADFALCGSYVHRPEPPLSCPITVFGGTDDPVVGYNGLRRWRAQTQGDFAVRMLPGGHFFPQTARGLLLRMLARDLHRYL